MKIHTYWKKNGIRVRKHQRSIDYGKRRLTVLCWFIMIICAGGVALNGVPQPKPEVKAEAIEELPTITNIDKEKGFESADYREPEARESRGDLFDKYFAENAKVMRAICTAESGLDPLVIGDMNTPHVSVGLCQIRILPERQITIEQMQNPEENVAYAKLLFDKHGFTPWSCWKNKSYLRYLN